MLLSLTALVDLLGSAVCLWFAGYLLARGYQSRVTVRAAVVLLALAASFFVAFQQLHQPWPGGANVWAALLTVALLGWYDLVYQLQPAPARLKTRWIARLIYLGGAVKFSSLLAQIPAAGAGGHLWVSPAWVFSDDAVGPALADLAFQTVTTVAAFQHLRSGARAGRGPHSRSTMVASALVVASVLYGLAAIMLSRPLPSLVQDALLLGAVSVLGYAVAIHQTFVERRTTLQDFPVSCLAVLGPALIYILAAWRYGLAPAEVGLIALLAILTHSLYDLAREFLDRLLHRQEAALRHQLHALARDLGGEAAARTSLQRGLSALCQVLGAAGGFIAERRGPGYTVTATYRSLPLDSPLAASAVANEDVSPSPAHLGYRIAWLAPAFAGGEKVAVIGVSERASRRRFSDADLDLLSETADWVGLTLALQARQQSSQTRLTELAAVVQTQALNLQSAGEELVAAIDRSPEAAFLQAVEQALRQLADYDALGQSPLAGRLGLASGAHLERGKLVRQRLVEAIERLRPAPQRPPEPLPREWHSYAILHDAYVADTPNREIMARLYISEATFARQRRKALRAIARALLEAGPG